MAINFASEYKKFEEMQEILCQEYRLVGMSEEQIEELYEFDKAQFARDLAYRRRKQSLFSGNGDFENETKNVLLKKFANVFTSTIKPDTNKHLWWMDEISDDNLIKIIKDLTSEQIELLDMYVFGDFNQADIAMRLGVNQSTVSRQLNKIKEILIKFNFHA